MLEESIRHAWFDSDRSEGLGRRLARRLSASLASPEWADFLDCHETH
jgi:hypothetical protein